MSRTGKSVGTESRIVVARVWGREDRGGGGGDCSWIWVSFWSDENVLELVVLLPNFVNTLKTNDGTLYFYFIFLNIFIGV